MLSLLIGMALLPRDPVADGFLNVPRDARLRMYWRIFGPAWQPSEIDYQLGQAKAAGLGGLTAYFMYPFAVDDPAKGVVNQKFLSDEFLQTYAYAAGKAKYVGLRFGVNGGTGWPFGGAKVSAEDAAHKLREVVVKPGQPIPKDHVIAAFEGRRALDLPLKGGYLPKDALHLYVESPTGQNVKRASYGAEGPVLDHFNEPALNRWLESTVEPILKAAPGLTEALGCDSLEVYGSNWARDLPAEFKKRRGYDLTPHLPEIFDTKNDAGNPVRFDYWRTLMELTEERFTIPLAKWSADHNVKLEMEAYGTPPNPMTAFRSIDVPTGEHYEWRGFAIQKYVASAAHMARRNIIGCEAWTWAGLPNRLADTLSDLKLVSDMEFLCGSNDLTGVDYPYSPRSAGQPGWVPYYGPTMNENNPQWEAFPGLVEYLNRCQWMLRQGDPKVSVALYLPVEDKLPRGGMEQMQLDFLIRDHFVTGKATSEFGLQNSLHHHSALIQGIFSHGFDYDGIDFWALNQMTSLRGTQLVAGTSQYSAVVLPNIEALEENAAEKLRRFAEAGGLVIAVRRVPDRAAGLRASQVRFRENIAAIFGASPHAGMAHLAGKGHGVLIGEDEGVGPYLTQALSPQISFSPIPDSVGFVHRTLKDRDIFFLANVQTEPVRLRVSFPRNSGSAEAWDAMTGQISKLPASGEISFPGRGSMFVVVRKGGTQAPSQSHPALQFADWKPTWHVSFEGPDAPVPLETDVLNSWTEWPGGRYFSGIGVYQADLDWQTPGARAVLAFDEVHEGAKILVNGEPAGYIFNYPHQLDIGPHLHAGRNHIIIRVGNVPANRFIALPDDDLKALRAKFGARFSLPEEKQIMSGPLPSGLIGRVRIGS